MLPSRLAVQENGRRQGGRRGLGKKQGRGEKGKEGR